MFDGLTPDILSQENILAVFKAVAELCTPKDPIHLIKEGVVTLGIATAVTTVVRAWMVKTGRVLITPKYVRATGLKPAQVSLIRTLMTPDQPRILQVSIPEISPNKINLIDINGTSSYYLLVKKYGKNFALAGDNLDAFRLAFGLKPGRNHALVYPTHLVELPPADSAEDILNRLRLDAACAQEAFLVGKTLFKTKLPNGNLVYLSRDVRCEIVPLGNRTIAVVDINRHQNDSIGTRFHEGSYRSAAFNATKYAKSGKLDVVINALYFALITDPSDREKLLSMYFPDGLSDRVSLAEKTMQKDVKFMGRIIRELDYDRLVEIYENAADPISTSLAASKKASIGMLRLLGHDTAPTSMWGLVEKKTKIQIGKTSFWPVLRGALKGAELAELPPHLMAYPHAEWSEFAEFLKLQFFMPLYGIYDDEKRLAKNAFGFCRLNIPGDHAHYAYYDPREDFSQQARESNLSATPHILGALTRKMNQACKVEHILAVAELLNGDKYILRYDQGALEIADCDKVLDPLTKTVLPGYRDAVWTTVEPDHIERSIQKIVARATIANPAANL